MIALSAKAAEIASSTNEDGLFISCGEVSGDSYAASITRAMRSHGYSKRIFGMAGEKSVAAGVEILWDARSLHLMGITEVLPAIPRLLRLRKEMVETILRTAPSTVLVIDSPDFHLPVLASLRSRGWRGRVVFAVPPTVWAWRTGRVRSLVRDVDLCLPLFRFEHEFLAARGVESAWKGHPLVDEFSVRSSFPKARDERRIALLPGSRGSEIRRILPSLKACAHLLKREGLSPVFSIAPGIADDLREWMKHELREERIFDGDGADLIASSIAAAGASGTVAVEAMMLDRFMVVLYKTSLLSEFVWKLLGKTNHISLPNILVGRENYPEFLQREASGENVFAALMRYLRDGAYRASVHEGLAAARGGMGEPGALDFWVEKVLEDSPKETLASESGPRP